MADYITVEKCPGGRATMVRWGGVKPDNGTDFKLDELQELVGGLIELVRTRVGKKLIVVNEEGKLLDLPRNPVATIYARELGAITSDDYIAGNAVICDDSEVK